MDREDWNRRYAGRELVWTSTPNRFLVAETAGLAPGRLLDLACGEGRNAVWFAERGWRATGVDFSEVALEKARALAAERGVEAEWRQADLVGSGLRIERSERVERPVETPEGERVALDALVRASRT